MEAEQHQALSVLTGGYGYVDLAFRLLGRLNRHLRHNREAFGETWSLIASPYAGYWRTMDRRAVAQGSAAWPAAFLLEHVVGIQPRLARLEALRLAPQPVVSSAEADWCGTHFGMAASQQHLGPDSKL